MDFTDAGAEVGAADIVVMNRVICCYPDVPRLAGAAAGRAGGVLVLSYPNGRWWTRLAVAVANLGLRAMRRQFTIFCHRPSLVRATAEHHGLRTTLDQPGAFWRVTAFERSPGP